jgi:hypothetical protein
MDLDEKSRTGKKILSLFFTSCIEIDGTLKQNFKIRGWGVGGVTTLHFRMRPIS